MELKIEVNVKGFDKLAEALLALANGKLTDSAEISDVAAVEITEVKEPKKAKAKVEKVEEKKEVKEAIPEVIGKIVEEKKDEIKIDMDYLKSLCLGLSKKNKGTAVKGILTEMGLAKASEVTEDKYPQLIKALEELNKALEELNND